VAEVVVPRDIVLERLKAAPEDLCDVNYRKNFLGSARAVSFGFNAHVANVVAAMYIACGQDPAHVVEGSNAITSAEMDGGDLLFTVSFPSMPLGTVGGGTGLATQGECLNLLGVKGGGSPPGANAKSWRRSSPLPRWPVSCHYWERWPRRTLPEPTQSTGADPRSWRRILKRKKNKKLFISLLIFRGFLPLYFRWKILFYGFIFGRW
jgi:hypothetical protein